MGFFDFFSGSNSNKKELLPSELKKLTNEQLQQLIQHKRKEVLKQYEFHDDLQIKNGLVGLKNLGNTCFMNSALQCLSNTQLLTQKILKNNIQNTVNPVLTRSQGALILEYKLLLEVLWLQNKQNSIAPSGIKKSIRSISKTFAGYAQQDSQEFLSFFLDALMDESNEIFIKPYIEAKDYENQDIKQFADIQWADFLKRNKSFIVDIFYGQYFTEITCPDCNYKSITCDPFDMMQLDFPGTRQQSKQFEFYIVCQSYKQKVMHVKAIVNFQENIKTTLQKVLEQINIENSMNLKLDDFKAFYQSKCKIYDTIDLDKTTIQEVNYMKYYMFLIQDFSDEENKIIYDQDQLNEFDREKNYKTVSLFINDYDGDHIGVEKQIKTSKSITTRQFAKLMISIHTNMKNGKFKGKLEKLNDLNFEDKDDIDKAFLIAFPNGQIKKKSLFQIKVDNENIEKFDDKKLFQNNKQHIRVDLQLHKDLFEDPDHIKFKACNTMHVDICNQRKRLDLLDCFNIFSNKETLDQDNMWYCRKCKDHKMAYIDRSLMKLPQVLIIHLKRFKKEQMNYGYVSYSKNNQNIDFPINNLDLSQYQKVKDGSSKYNLYGVVNHYGSCGGGHYTAHCKNHLNNKWYYFDDSSVSKSNVDEISGKAAYLLFYQKVQFYQKILIQFIIKLFQYRFFLFKLIRFFFNKIQIIIAMLCSSKPNKNVIPFEIRKFKLKYSDLTDEEILAVYHQFKGVTDGNEVMKQQQFQDFLQKLNLFANAEVYDKMFKLVCKNNDKNTIGFSSFLDYMYFLLKTPPKKKIKFIFQMIARLNKDFFNFKDLTEFYRKVNSFVTEHNSMQQINESLNISQKQVNNAQYEEMAQIAFEVMNKPLNEKIKLKSFQKFLSNNPNLVKLFDFLTSNIGNSQEIKNKQLLTKVIADIESLLIDADGLENVIFPNSQQDQKQRKTVSKFSVQFYKTLLKNPQVRNHRYTQQFQQTQYNSEYQFNTFKESVFFQSNLQSENPTIDDLLEEEPKVMKPHPTRSWKNKDLDSALQQISKLIISIKLKGERIIERVTKELNKLEQKEEKLFKNRNGDKWERQSKLFEFLGEENLGIIVNMISGIQKSISIINNERFRILNTLDFKLHNKIEMQSIAPKYFVKCKFKDFAPNVFQEIRKFFGIQNEQYLNSIGVNDFESAFFKKYKVLNGEKSSGKSGSFFFNTEDGKYMIKTIPKEEFIVLKRILPSYYRYIVENSKTLLPRFFGLHQIKCYKQNGVLTYDIFIVVMNNVFSVQNPKEIQEKFDLKGSMYKRETPQDQAIEGKIKKDKNFIKEKTKIFLNQQYKFKIIEQLKKDSEFLAKHDIIDYSLLLGIKQNFTNTSLIIEDSFKKVIKRRVTNFQKGIQSEDQSYTYYLGIIDTLTHFGMRKKGEFISKVIVLGPSVSCIPPQSYKKRFQKFMEKVFDQLQQFLLNFLIINFYLQKLIQNK